ncbi:type IV secretion system immunity protein Tsi7 [Pseudomonas aeruginosa]|uniref:type IV secretion system immunity protein Tsi7 n=1 Tax=Pseudomonas aeruginosa TaxID=287 RepID=UPI0018AC7C58|nr:type IV secretion system immunity protein Tsi7 [Pseudomonas aeruginosa]MBF8797070.1 hypothetical protein [Pseudomonas aeruginosa]
MLKKLSPIFSNITGVVRYQDLAYVASVSDEIQEQNIAHSYVTEWDCGTWCVAGEDDDMLPWEIVSATVVHEPVEQALFLGARGQVFCMGSGDIHEEQLPDGDDAIGGRGNMRGVASIDGVAYACGMDRQVYRRFDENDWRAIDSGARPPAGSEAVVGFEAIGGFGAREIYAVGWDGEIWQYDGKRWQPRESPTNLILTAICCAEDGSVYACGQAGTLLRGRNDHWEIIAQDDVDEDLWSLAWFDGALYVSSATAVYTLVGGHLKEVDFGDEQPQRCFHLSAADGVLWSIAAKDIFSFDGQQWTRID